jgi:hypothetical protein
VDAAEAAEAARMAARMAAAEAAAAAEGEALLARRRDALLTCIEAAHASYRWPWAQTTVDMLVDAAQSCAPKFAPQQRERLQRVYTQARAPACACVCVGDASDAADASRRCAMPRRGGALAAAPAAALRPRRT